MAYNWIVKGSEKNEFQRVLFEHYFSPLKLNKTNLKIIKKQSQNENKKEYEELFELYKNDKCLPTAFKYSNNSLIKYLITLIDKSTDEPSKFCSHVMLAKVCTCSNCKRDNLDCMTYKRDPFLFMAADYANQEIINWLTSELKVDINYTDDHHENILFYSTHFKDITFIKWLINDKKINYKILNTNKSNLLFKACISDNLNLVKYLIDELEFDINYENKLKQTCLYYCCYSKTTEVFDYLVQKYSIDFKNLRDSFNITIMQNSRTIQFLEHLIKNYDYDIDHIDKINKNNLLFYATSFENIDLIDYIFKNSSSSIYEVDKHANSILYISLIILEAYELSSTLIKKYKIDVNHINEKGHNILFSAISKSKFQTAKWIIKNTNIDLFHKQKEGYDIMNDLIHYFDHEEDFEDFKDLMKYIFTNTNFKYNHKYIFDICCDKSSHQINIMILNFMIKAFKSNIRYTDKKGQDILIRAITFDMDIEFIKYLITFKGVDVFLKDKDGKDAFYYAYNHKNFSEITYNIYTHKNNTLMSLIPKHLQLKQMYSDLIREKHELEKKQKTNTLNDSGTDLNFDVVKITDQDKINMFDDLLTYTTNLKLQVLTAGKEPIECKNQTLSELV